MQRGDTIVEVLISMTVIALVLAGAYVTTNRSIQNTRAAQERGNALKLAEAQVEQLKGVIATDPNLIFNNAVTTSPFCIYNNAPVAASNTNCTQKTDGTAAGSVEPKFALSMTKSGNNFTVVNTWSHVSGKSIEKLQITYRVYP
jgi:prepilin-type N-terminal cleavage/methylation domain-containing protein